MKEKFVQVTLKGDSYYIDVTDNENLKDKLMWRSIYDAGGDGGESYALITKEGDILRHRSKIGNVGDLI